MAGDGSVRSTLTACRGWKDDRGWLKGDPAVDEDGLLGAPELRRAVAELRGLRSHVLAFGHAPWAVWRSAGLCQVSGRPVAQPEEGLQDELGKHHICWESAIDHCDWHAVVAAEASAEPVDEQKKKAVGTPAYIAERLAWARVERAFQKK